MNAAWLVFLHDIRANLRTGKVTFLLLLSVLLPLVTTPLLVYDYQDRLATYQKSAANDRQALQQIPAYSALQVAVQKRPSILAGFSRGIEEQVSSRLLVSLKRPVHFERKVGSDNPFLALLYSFDLSIVISTIFSLFALGLSFDLICREKENGSLKLVLSHGVSRGSLFVGKVAARFSILVLALAVFFGISALTVEAIEPGAALAELSAGTLLFLASACYLAVFFLLGTLISTRVHRSSVSFLINVAFWGGFVILLPQMSVNLFASRDGETENREIQQALDSIVPGFFAGIYRIRENEPPEPKEGYSDLGWSESKLPFFVVIQPYPTLVDYYLEEIPPVERAAVEVANRLSRQQQNLYRGQYSTQRQRLRRSMFSPAVAFQYLSGLLCGTDASAYSGFLEEAYRYRNRLLNHFDSNGIFDSKELFVQTRELGVQSLPNFREQDWRTAGGGEVLFVFSLMLTQTAVLFLAGFWSFARYDVR